MRGSRPRPQIEGMAVVNVKSPELPGIPCSINRTDLIMVLCSLYEPGEGDAMVRL